MLPDRVSNPGPLTYESGVLPIALRGLAPLKQPQKNLYHSVRKEKLILCTAELPKTKIFVVILEAEGPVL